MRAVHVGVRGRLGDDGRLAHPLGHLQRLADHPPQLVQVERLEQVVVGSLLHRLDGRVRRLGHGDEDDRDAGVEAADLLVDLQPGLVGEAEVEQDHIRRPLGDATDPLRAGTGHINPVLRGAEDLVDLRQDQVRVVVHKQQLAHGAPRRPTRLELLPEPPPPVRGAMTKSIPQNSRNQRRVLPSTRRRLTRLGR